MSVEAKPGLNDLESIIGAGENAKGFTAQTANGTAHAMGTGWNRDQPNWDDWAGGGVMGAASVGDGPPEWATPDHQLRPSPTWPGGRSNRTGE